MNNYLLFEEEHLFSCIQRHGESRKSHEVYAAIKIKRVLEKKIDPGNYLIGFKVKPAIVKKAGKMPCHELDQFLNNEVDEDDPLDVLFQRAKDENRKLQNFAFQIKRFGLGKEAPGGTEKLIRFFERYRHKYATRIIPSLAITAYGTNATEPIDYEAVATYLKRVNYPFQEVWYMLPHKVVRDTRFRYVRLLPMPVAIIDLTRQEMIQGMSGIQVLNAMAPKDFAGTGQEAFENLFKSLLK